MGKRAEKGWKKGKEIIIKNKVKKKGKRFPKPLALADVSYYCYEARLLGSLLLGCVCTEVAAAASRLMANK